MPQPAEGGTERRRDTAQRAGPSSPAHTRMELETIREVFSCAKRGTQYAARAAVELGGSSHARARHELELCRGELHRAEKLIASMLLDQRRG